LDNAFLQRAYRANLIFGAVLCVSIGIITRSLAASMSCAMGLLSGLMVLKAKELFVRRMVRSKDALPYDGPDKWLPRWAIGPGKFLLVVAAILLLRRIGMMDYVSFVIGCATVQLVVISMALGHLMAQRDAGRSLREIYVTPHQNKNTTHV
jgi:hypothetical protein